MNMKLCNAVAGVLLLAAASPACASSLIANGGFDDVATTDPIFAAVPPLYKTLPNYVYPAGGGAPMTAGNWTYDGGAGLVYRPPGGSPLFDGADPLSDHQYGFLQDIGSISQQFTSSVSGGTTLSWYQASRQNGGSYGFPAGNQTYDVIFNGTTVGTFSTNVSSTGWTAESIAVSLLVGTNTLSFVGTVTNPDGNGPEDQTAFIENVNIDSHVSSASTPLPAAWTMFVGGAAGLGYIARKSRRRRACAV